MLEADVLNARAWALDAVGESQSTWRCETIFDGLGGDRPNEREGALECPKERTRVQCSFDPATGALICTGKAEAPLPLPRLLRVPSLGTGLK